MYHSITLSGYLREIETSFCQDSCGEFYIESENSDVLDNIKFDDSFQNIELYINRFVEITGEETFCIECFAIEVLEITISDECLTPVDCFENPCEAADECQLNTPVECISNYCDGCYADFYDLDGNLVNCYYPDCVDLSGIDFGDCDMVLGIAWNGTECQYFSGCDWIVGDINYSNNFFDSMNECEEACNSVFPVCEEIFEEYENLHSDEFLECNYDMDCMPVWGDCDVGLGGCHYAVNDSYPEEEIHNLVEMWIENDCMTWACDCMELPYAVCANNQCELAYCDTPNPAGCNQTGCSSGYDCVDDSEYNCAASFCNCDWNAGSWFCTEDCNGGTCISQDLQGDFNHDEVINILDIVLIVNHILSSDYYMTSYEEWASDINEDGVINILDVVWIIQVILNFNDSNIVADIDGNIYEVIQIGNQLWIAENLKVMHYKNGDEISSGLDNENWASTEEGSYVIYNNNPQNTENYGNLYNWYAVNDNRGVCPEGFHVPTDQEFKELEIFLGMSESEANSTGYRGINEGSKLGGYVDLWNIGNLVNDSEFGLSDFNVVPGGFCHANNINYDSMGYDAYFWTSSETWYRRLHYNTSKIARYDIIQNYGIFNSLY